MVEFISGKPILEMQLKMRTLNASLESRVPQDSNYINASFDGQTLHQYIMKF